MSHLMTALAMRQEGLKPAAKIVLYWLADHHNGETGRCNPSINRLAKRCEMSRRSVENHLQSLQDAGLIEISNQHRDRGGKTANIYTLRLTESDTQNLRMGSAKSAHGDTQNLRMKNLGTNNLGNEPVSIHAQEDLLGITPAKDEKKTKVSMPEGWVPNSVEVKFAEENGLNENEIKDMADEFQIYWADRNDKDSKKTARGWTSAWKNNVRNNAFKFIRLRKPAYQQNGSGQQQASGLAGAAMRSRLARQQRGDA